MYNIYFKDSDGTGGEFTGWPSIEAHEDEDITIVHRAGFKQEYWGDLSLRETLANAGLMASAPDLLKALERLMSSFMNVAKCDPEEYGAYVNALEAVMKARGGSKFRIVDE